MKRRRIAILVVAVCMLALPAGVLATKYSNVIWLNTVRPPGYPWTMSCGQAGIVDVAVNYNQSLSRTAESCATGRVLPATYLGSLLYGYRDGAYCGRTNVSYSNQATSGWQHWAWICSNPSGQQWFHTVGRSYMLNQWGKYSIGDVTSPQEDY